MPKSFTIKKTELLNCVFDLFDGVCKQQVEVLYKLVTVKFHQANAFTILVPNVLAFCNLNCQCDHSGLSFVCFP